jgi:hypothetical protein
VAACTCAIQNTTPLSRNTTAGAAGDAGQRR